MLQEFEQEERVVEINPEQARQIESACKERIKVADALERLMSHADFKLVFMEEYLEKEPGRITGLLTDGANYVQAGSSEKRNLWRDDLNERLIGISRFSEYLRKVFGTADMCQKQLNGLAEARVNYNNS